MTLHSMCSPYKGSTTNHIPNQSPAVAMIPATPYMQMSLIYDENVYSDTIYLSLVGDCGTKSICHQELVLTVSRFIAATNEFKARQLKETAALEKVPNLVSNDTFSHG